MRKTFSTGLVLGLFLGMLLTACGAIKIYKSDPDRGGAYRKQDNELVLYRDTKDWALIPPDDMQEITTKYASCQKELEECQNN